MIPEPKKDSLTDIWISTTETGDDWVNKIYRYKSTKGRIRVVDNDSDKFLVEVWEYGKDFWIHSSWENSLAAAKKKGLEVLCRI